MPNSSDRNPNFQRTLITYYGTLAVMFLAAFFPLYRSWGINWWAHFHYLVPITLFLVGAMLPVLFRVKLLRYSEPDYDSESESGNPNYFLSALALILLFGLAFYFLRTNTHFMGDGYQLLSRLADGIPSAKMWDIGISALNDLVYSFLSGDPETRALATFQLISMTSGICLLVAVAIISYYLFERNIERLLFLAGLSTGGYMLLFFGYVENYAPLSVAIFLFALFGLMIIREKISVWWLLLPFVMALAFHLFAVALFPSLLYLLLRKSSMGRMISKHSDRTKVIWMISLVILGATLYAILRAKSYFLTFALLPMFPDRFTVDNDWLSSPKHLVDMLNLLVLLLPSLIMFVVLFVSNRKTIWRPPEVSFLLILFVSTLGVDYVFNPRLGMPRDWDLFAIVGPPLAILFYYSLLRIRLAGKYSQQVGWLAVALGLLMLGPRVVSQASPEIALEHFKYYVTLDKMRNRTAWSLLHEYPGPWGEGRNVEIEISDMKKDLPSEKYVLEGRLLRSQGKLVEATSLFRRAVDENPVYSDAWSNLGESYMKAKQYDSALIFLEIANGLNPYNANTLNNLGSVHFYTGYYEAAADYWERSVIIDTAALVPRMNLVRVYQTVGDNERYFSGLKELAGRPGVPHTIAQELGDYCLKIGDVVAASRAYRVALDKGLDSTYVSNLAIKYPILNRLFHGR